MINNDLLISEFDGQMRDIYYNAKKIANYNATVFWRMVCEHDGYEAAKRLLAGDDNTQGFTTLAFIHGKPELTMEYLIYYNKKFHVLFTQDEINTCKSRLGIK